MYHVNRLEEQISYASEANALAAVEKVFGAPEGSGDRLFNLMLARNAKGRVVPILYNVKDLSLVMHCCKFMIVN